MLRILIAVWAWQRIRLLRANPPGLAAGDDERTDVFVSALEQAEQLMQAASDIGPAARPLPLFYALSQAGRSIAAARLPDPWRLAGHGLSAPPRTPDAPLLACVVKPDRGKPAAGRRHSFAGVAEAVGSDRLTHAAPIGAVWAALPDLIEPAPQLPLEDEAWKRPLVAYLPDWWGDPSHIATRQPFQLGVDGLPEGLDADALLETLLADYPSAAGAMVRQIPGVDDRRVLGMLSPLGRSLPVFVWRHMGDRTRILERIAPDYRRRGVRLLLPRLGQDALSPLMLWWVLLFGLSSVARYDPELWVSALDVNASKLAVPIEAALETGLGALPELILDALTGP